jgi:hypothetical protein
MMQVLPAAAVENLMMMSVSTPPAVELSQQESSDVCLSCWGVLSSCYVILVRMGHGQTAACMRGLGDLLLVFNTVG